MSRAARSVVVGCFEAGAAAPGPALTQVVGALQPLHSRSFADFTCPSDWVYVPSLPAYFIVLVVLRVVTGGGMRLVQVSYLSVQARRPTAGV